MAGGRSPRAHGRTRRRCRRASRSTRCDRRGDHRRPTVISRHGAVHRRDAAAARPDRRGRDGAGHAGTGQRAVRRRRGFSARRWQWTRRWPSRSPRSTAFPRRRYVALRAHEITPGTPGALAHELGLPLFVKPANMGSSVGVTKAKTVEAVRDAIDVALLVRRMGRHRGSDRSVARSRLRYSATWNLAPAFPAKSFPVPSSTTTPTSTSTTDRKQ